MWKRCLLVCLLGLGLALALPAHAETRHCIAITSVPTVLSTQGVYCLEQNLSTGISTGTAITVATNNVTIDCNDYKLGGLAGGDATQATGIYAGNRVNVTVRNCNVRGFYFGVRLIGSYMRVEHNVFDGNKAYGIYLDGSGFSIRDNQVSDTGGSTLVPGAYGILATGDGGIVDNTVAGVVAAAGTDGFAYGIYTTASSSGAVSDNRVRGLASDGIGKRYGIYNLSSGQATMRANTIVLGIGRDGDIGISCASSAGVAKDNAVLGIGAGVALQACDDGGGNFVN